LIARYTDRFQTALDSLEGTPANVLRRYVKLYEDVLVRDRMCLCGMFAAEYSTLPVPMRGEIRRFFDRNEAWLALHLEEGRVSGALRYEGSPLELARMLTAGLEGAMLLARSYEDPNRFTAIAERLLAELGVPHLGKRS
jgi:TetR/AcrR family transcriptional regulator, transcriptional repressor for nem operon